MVARMPEPVGPGREPVETHPKRVPFSMLERVHTVERPVLDRKGPSWIVTSRSWLLVRTVKLKAPNPRSLGMPATSSRTVRWGPPKNRLAVCGIFMRATDGAATVACPGPSALASATRAATTATPPILAKGCGSRLLPCRSLALPSASGWLRNKRVIAESNRGSPDAGVDEAGEHRPLDPKRQRQR